MTNFINPAIITLEVSSFTKIKTQQKLVTRCVLAFVFTY